MQRLLALIVALIVSLPAAAGPTADELVARLRTVDERQRSSGDFQARVYLEQKEKGKADLVYEAEVYRRDADDKLVIFFTRPQAEAGKGYLRIDANLFVYDPTVGRWERRTERERIGGTASNRGDFDESRLADEYAPAYVGDELLGQFAVERLRLSALEGVDVAYPVVEVWLDKATGNMLKRQDFALSGRLLRTTYYPQWIKVFSPSKNADVYYAREIRIFDEVEQGTNTTIVFQQVQLDPLEDSIFTKAWLEAKSR
jgi:hypothetical protein